MNGLILSTTTAYDLRVPAKSGTGRENPTTLGDVALLTALFLCVAPLWRAMQGHRKMGRVPSSRFLTPVSFATIPVRRELANSMLVTRSLHYV